MYDIQRYVEGMKTIDNVYDKIARFDDLYQSYLKAREKKKLKGDILAFTDNLEDELIQLENELIWNEYDLGPYEMHKIYEPKVRIVMSIGFRDRIVQWSIYRYLFPFYNKLFINDSYACRKDKGTHAAADRLQYWLRQVNRRPEKYYYLKLDMSKFFYRVDHEILLNILRVRIKDERLLSLLEKIINSETQKFGLPLGVSADDYPYELWLDDVGMPIGNLTSQLFANIYLNELDQFCKHKLKTHFYVRYQDDIIVLSDNKQWLHEVKDQIEIFLDEVLHLNLNNKTAIRPIDGGIEFVGYRIWATHKKLKVSTARKILRTVPILCEKLAKGEMTREEFDRRAASYNGMFEHCNSCGLRTKLNNCYLIAMEKFCIKNGGNEIGTTSG